MLWDVEWERGWDKWDSTKYRELNNILAVIDEFYDRRFIGWLTKQRIENSEYNVFAEVCIVDDRYPGIIYSAVRMNEESQEMQMRKIKHQIRLLLRMFSSKYMIYNGIVKNKIGEFDFYFN